MNQVPYYHHYTLKNNKVEDCSTANTLLKADHVTPTTTDLNSDLSGAIPEEEDQKMSVDEL